MDYIKLYSSWLKGLMSQKEHSEATSLTLPYLDRAFDFIEIYILKEGDTFLLTDDGETLNSLSMEGIEVSDEELKPILESFSVEREENELIVRCKLEELAFRIHMLAMCIIKISNKF